MSIQNKSVYKTYQDLLINDPFGGDHILPEEIACPICNNGTKWRNCSKHYARSLIRYIQALTQHMQHLELRVAEAETTVMVLGRQNYELRGALKSSQNARKYYNNVAVDLAKTLHDKRHDLTNEK